jgi:hypothetical protein
MKFILNGRTFDTATSETIAIDRGTYDRWNQDMSMKGFPGADEVRFETVLYRTAKGALFIHHHATAKYKSGKPVTTDTAEEMESDEAVKWIAEENAAVINSEGLPLPDEA